MTPLRYFQVNYRMRSDIFLLRDPPPCFATITTFTICFSGEFANSLFTLRKTIHSLCALKSLNPYIARD